MRVTVPGIIQRLIAWRLPLLLLGVAMALLAWAPARRLHFDRSIENMFAPDDPLLGPYRTLKRTFGGTEVVLAVYRDPKLLHPDGRGIRRLAAVSARLAAAPGVEDVVSLDQPRGAAIVDPESPLSARLRKLFEGYTHGADGRTVAVVCMLTPEAQSPVPRPDVVRRLRQIVATLPGGMITGEPVMVVDGFRYVEQDGARLGWASTLLMGLTLLVCFRSLRWVLAPIAVVQWTLLTTKATLVWSGLRLSMVSSMLTAIVTVVGIATVVHIIVRFRDARLAGRTPREALAHAGGLLAVPIFWACATDAVGFASLGVARVGPVQDFGLMMAVGSLMVVVGVALILPGLALAGRFGEVPRRLKTEAVLDAGLNRLVDWVERRPKTVALGTAILVAVAGAGAGRLEVETDFTRNFRSTSPLARSYRFVETHLGGAGMGDVVVPAPARLDWEYLRKLRHFEDRLRREVVVRDPLGNLVPGLTKVLSMADGVVANTPYDPEQARLAVLRRAMVGASLQKIEEAMPALANALHGEDAGNPGRYHARVMFRAKERQPSAEKQRLLEQARRIAREEFPPTDSDKAPGAEVTGFFVLLTNLIESMVRDQWVTFGVAAAGIGLMMVLALRSPLLAVIALAPNAMPIVIVTGLMGWLGLKINMGAAMIAAVSMGLSIDSSIHYITFFRRARAEGRSVHESLASVHRSVGRAMVLSTLALIVGFSVLCTSQFVPTIYFGVLVSLTMLGGLVGNLLVLPMLLRWLAPPQNGGD